MKVRERRAYEVLSHVPSCWAVYDLSGQTRSAPVTADRGRLQFTLPFEPRALVFQGNKITATAANNANVDTWEKVE